MGKWVHRLTSKDIPNRRGVCINCGDVRIRLKHGKVWCCSKGQAKWPVRSKRKPHGLTMEEARQYTKGKSCKICEAKTKLVVDHCHKTKIIRGILCSPCNIGLGHFRDNPELLSAAISYLAPVPRIELGSRDLEFR